MRRHGDMQRAEKKELSPYFISPLCPLLGSGFALPAAPSFLSRLPGDSRPQLHPDSTLFPALGWEVLLRKPPVLPAFGGCCFTSALPAGGGSLPSRSRTTRRLGCRPSPWLRPAGKTTTTTTRQFSADLRGSRMIKSQNRAAVESMDERWREEEEEASSFSSSSLHQSACRVQTPFSCQVQANGYMLASP